jgi:hypothetical protein
MVNYVYVLSMIERNNQNYLLDGTISLVEPVSADLSWACSQPAANIKFIGKDGSKPSENGEWNTSKL